MTTTSDSLAAMEDKRIKEATALGHALLLEINEFFRHNGWVDPSTMFDDQHTFKQAVAHYLAKASPFCSTCGQPATCYGTYEGITGYGCDVCCGHGNEDGHCVPVAK